MNEKFNKNAKVEQLTNMFLSRGEEKGLIVKDHYDLNQFLNGKFWCSHKATNQPKSTVELGHMYPRRLTVPPVVTLTR